MSDTPAETDPPFEARYFRKELGLRQSVRGEVDEAYGSLSQGEPLTPPA